MTPAQPLPCPFCGAPGERAGSMVVCSKICHGCYAIDEKLWNRRRAVRGAAGCLCAFRQLRPWLEWSPILCQASPRRCRGGV